MELNWLNAGSFKSHDQDEWHMAAIGKGYQILFKIMLQAYEQQTQFAVWKVITFVVEGKEAILVSVTPLVSRVYFSDHPGSLDNPNMDTRFGITNYHSDFRI